MQNSINLGVVGKVVVLLIMFFCLFPDRGLILQDLTFVHLGNPDFIEGKVNFSKRWQQFNILDSMRRFQQV